MKNAIAAGALGLMIVGGVAVAQTSNTQGQMDTTSTTQAQTGTQNMGNQTSGNPNTGTPYNQSNTMQGGSQDGSASQWAGERG